MSLCFFFYKRKDSPLILTQHKIPSQIHIINIIRYSVTLHSHCLSATLASCCHLQNKRHLVEAWYSLEQYIGLKEDKLSSTTVDFTVVDESLSSFKPMYCSREYQASTRLIQQYEKSTLKRHLDYPLHFMHPISKTNYTKRSSTKHDLLCQLFIFCFFLFIATNRNNQNTKDKMFSITHDTLIQPVASLIQSNPTFWPIQNKTILTTLSFHDVFAKIFHLITHAPP